MVTFRVAGLAVKGGWTGCELWPKVQHTLFCREIIYVASYARDEGGSQKVTNDDEGEGGHDTPQK